MYAAAGIVAARIRGDDDEARRLTNEVPSDEIRYTAIYMAGMVSELVTDKAGAQETAVQLIPGMIEAIGEDAVNASTLAILKGAESDLGQV